MTLMINTQIKLTLLSHQQLSYRHNNFCTTGNDTYEYVPYPVLTPKCQEIHKLNSFYVQSPSHPPRVGR